MTPELDTGPDVFSLSSLLFFDMVANEHFLVNQCPSSMTLDETAGLIPVHGSNQQSEYRWPRHITFLILLPPGYQNIDFSVIDQLVNLAHHCQHNLLVSFHDAHVLFVEHADEAVICMFCSNDIKPDGFGIHDTLPHVSVSLLDSSKAQTLRAACGYGHV